MTYRYAIVSGWLIGLVAGVVLLGMRLLGWMG